MTKKFPEALSLLWNNLRLFTAIVLTVWVPGNFLINFVAYHVDISEMGFMRLTMLVGGILSPINIGALVYALYQIKMGRTVTYGEAMSVGFRKWGTLLAARFVAGFFIALGLIALIVPGIILLVRYSLLESAIVIEGVGPSGARARSTELTVGRRGQILGASILFFILFFLLSFAIYLPLDYVDSLNMLPVVVVMDCILDIAFEVIGIVLFLYYWDSIQPIASAEPADGADGGPGATEPDRSWNQ